MCCGVTLPLDRGRSQGGKRLAREAGEFLAAQATHPIAAGLFQEWSSQAKLFEVRHVLEPGLAALAARRATAEQIERRRAIVTEQRGRVERGESYMEQGTAFHTLIAEVHPLPAGLPRPVRVMGLAVSPVNGASA